MTQIFHHNRNHLTQLMRMCPSAFPPLAQAAWHPQLTGEKVYSGSRFQGVQFMVGWLRKEMHGGRVWQSKATQFTAARKESTEEERQNHTEESHRDPMPTLPWPTQTHPALCFTNLPCGSQVNQNLTIRLNCDRVSLQFTDLYYKKFQIFWVERIRSCEYEFTHDLDL